jgi:uncharacterized membrane protein YgcG
MATLPGDPRDNHYPPTGYPYRPGAAPRPPAPRRPSAGEPEQRLPKPQALEFVRDLKRAAGVGAVLIFGVFVALIAGRLSSANAASTSGTGVPNDSSNGSLFGGNNQNSSDAHGGYFGQQTGSGSFGSFGGGGFSSGPVTGSSVS